MKRAMTKHWTHSPGEILRSRNNTPGCIIISPGKGITVNGEFHLPADLAAGDEQAGVTIKNQL